MSYIVYSATSLESFLKRRIERNGEVYYNKSLHKPKYYDEINVTERFDVSADRARKRLLDRKTPLIMALESDIKHGLLQGNTEHLILELWLEQYNNPKPDQEVEKEGFLRYEPMHLMRIMDSYELMGGVFIKKE